MQASARKMKRTRMQEKMILENMNRQGLDHLFRNIQGLVDEIVLLQKNVLALMLCLKGRGIIDDLMIQQKLSEIDEMEEMKRKALIIDPNKK